MILLDLGLPDMDGYELARKLRAAPGGDRPFVIALTGRSREEVFDQVRASGCDGHLLKPYEVDQLEQALAAVPRRDYGVPQNPAMPSSAPSTRSAAKHSRATAAACADAEE